MIKFIDGKTHGVDEYWYIYYLGEKLFKCGLCAALVVSNKRFAMFYWLLLVYESAGTLLWMYNYSEDRRVFYTLYPLLWIACLYYCWPRNGKVVKMGMV